ncbi:MAG: hypothetical protein NUK63_00065 [Candidatus Bathyarchaeum tardum]|nr:MAG: hypothetical protein NUK63_00065 [Candidatus Bathyarchaeum tardum]
MKKLPFIVEVSKNTNILLSGANNSGKTSLACSIASRLHKIGFTCIVLDVSGTWKNVSDLPHYSKITITNGKIRIPRFEQNISRIYDLSALKLSETKRVVERLSEQIWNERIDQKKPTPTFLFLEESECFLKSIRGNDAQSIYRLIHVGRNINTRCVLVTTDLALIDSSIIRLCGIRFHGFLNVEENSKRKFRSYYGRDFTRVAMEGLETGDFIRFQQYNRTKPLDVVSVPLFMPKTKPRQYLPAPSQPKIKEIKIPRQRSFFSKFLELFMTKQDRIIAQINRLNQHYETVAHHEEWEQQDEKDWFEWLIDEDEWKN